MTAVELRISPPRPCGRCERQGLLTVDVPTSWVGDRQQTVSGRLPVVLCAHCDHDAPGAGPLIMFLTVHDRIDHALFDQFADYVHAWLRHVRTKPDPHEIAQDEAAWRRGEFE